MTKLDLTNVPTVDNDDAGDIITDVLNGYAEHRGLGIEGVRDAVSLGEDIQRIEETLRALLHRSALLDVLLAERADSDLRKVAARVRDQLADVLTQEETGGEPEPAPETKYQRPDWLPEGWRVKWEGADLADSGAKVGDIVAAYPQSGAVFFSGKVSRCSPRSSEVALETYPGRVGSASAGLSGSEHGWTYYIIEREWITWHGGECPVDPTTHIEVELRSGSKYQDHAGDFRWSCLEAGGDIVKYRIID